MRCHVEATWGLWDPLEQREKHCANFTPETHRIILVDDVAGFVATEDFPSHLWLVKLYVFKKYRGMGNGSQVLQGLLS